MPTAIVMFTSLTDVTMPQWQVTSFIDFTLVSLQGCAFYVPKAIAMLTSITDVTMPQWQVTSFIDFTLVLLQRHGMQKSCYNTIPSCTRRALNMLTPHLTGHTCAHQPHLLKLTPTRFALFLSSQ